MLFDLAKAIVYRDVRQGKRFTLTPPVLALLNEQIDRLQRQVSASTAATGGRENVPGATQHDKQSL
jgi:hypothetical protein